uniref:Transcriptional activator protein n=1 Tax=Cotton leaf curl Multan virus TaxID=223252 RepID=F6KNS9_9GEMI|nr:transcriptional activator protein [Cotton leaf curl Multan virus]
MRSSSLSKDHCTQLPIKVQHREAKRRNRRRRVDLECGCSYYLSINCHNHGFTHREPITAAQAGNGAYIWEVPNPLYFKIISHSSPSIHDKYGHTHDPNPIQLQHSESSGTAQVFSNLPNLDDLTPSDWSFLKGIQNPSPQISEQSRCNFN